MSIRPLKRRERFSSKCVPCLKFVKMVDLFLASTPTMKGEWIEVNRVTRHELRHEEFFTGERNSTCFRGLQKEECLKTGLLKAWTSPLAKRRRSDLEFIGEVASGSIPRVQKRFREESKVHEIA